MDRKSEEIRDREVRQRLSPSRGEIDPDPSRTEDELESLRLELARTRAQMSDTVYAIQGRMEPQYVREQATAQAKDTAKDAGSTVTRTVRENPVPAALTGAGLLGLGWLIASGAKESSQQQNSLRDGPYYYGYPERSYPTYYEDREFDESSGASEGGSGRERARQAGGLARERAGQMGDRLQGRANEATDEARQRTQQAKGGFQKALRENPLAVGIAAIGLGTAVGLAIPESGKENELMGETRDHLANRAQRGAQETARRAQRVAEEARRAAREEADNQDLTEQ